MRVDGRRHERDPIFGQRGRADRLRYRAIQAEIANVGYVELVRRRLARTLAPANEGR